MNAQLGPEAADDPAAERGERSASGRAPGTRTTAIWGPDKVARRPARATDRRSPATWSSSPPASGPTSTSPSPAGFTVERAIVVDDQMRTLDDDDVYAVGECAQHRGEVYGLVAPLWEQAVVLADHVTGAEPDAASTTAPGRRPSSRSPASTSPRWASPEPETRHRRARRLLRAEHAASTSPSSSATTSSSARPCSATAARSPSCSRPSTAACRCPRSGAELLFDLGGPAAEVGVAELRRRRPGLQLQRRQQGRHRAARSPAAARRVAGGHGQDPGRQGLRLLQEPGRADRRVGRRRRRRGGPVGPLLRAGHPDGQAGADGRDPRAGPAVGVGGLRRARPGRRRGREVQDGPGLAAEDDVGRGRTSTSADARFINDRVHANIQKDGTFSVVPQMNGGVTTPEQLRRIADVAEKYEVPMVKLTGGQRIDLLGIRKEDLPGVWADLDMPSGYAYGKSFRTVKTCVGQDFCRFGAGDSTELGIEIETRFQGMESPAKMKLAVSGCPRNCAESLRQGRRRRRHRGRPLGDLRRRRGRRARPQGRPAGHRRRRRDRQAAHRPVPAVLPGERATGWSAPTPSCPGSASRRSAPSSSTTARASPSASTRPSGTTSTRYVDPWQEGTEPADPGPVPHLAAAGGAAAGAGPTGPRASSEARGDGHDATGTGVAHRLGPSTRSRRARAAPSASTASRSPSSGSATARCARCPRSARTGAGRSPTARSTTASSSARCT